MNKELIDRAKRFVENHNCWVDSDFTAEEKADEIAGLRNNDTFEWMADFAEECVKDERKRIAELMDEVERLEKREKQLVGYIELALVETLCHHHLSIKMTDEPSFGVNWERFDTSCAHCELSRAFYKTMNNEALADSTDGRSAE